MCRALFLETSGCPEATPQQHTQSEEGMATISKIKVAEGVYYVTVHSADVSILCGCPADSVKHLMKRGLIKNREADGIHFETGPDAVLLSDMSIQNGQVANLSEFPILQMFYRQGRIVPGHPNNTGLKPVVIGSRRQLAAQMEYALRGNYGLVTEEEIVKTGVAPAAARDMMRLKLSFAFGKIRRMEEYLDLVALENKPKEIRNGVFVRRIKFNLFEISCGRHSVRVDLNLPEDARSEPPYTLGFHQIRRDYFAVLHSGGGDGWDPSHPSMASILLFQGKVYLIDAGPNILHTLSALGISVNEIAGIFHTHAHDDHFCGLPDLMRAARRIPYYATAPVRASVLKKLAALTMMDEAEFSHYFEFHDLAQGEWNDIDTLEVKPMPSPHPVETTVLFFRTLDCTGYRTYAHMADIASLTLLRGMVTTDGDAPGISREYYDAVAHSYRTPVDLKKLDIGGGMIHGDAEDFAQDKSDKIILAHTALRLTTRQKEIGSGAPFGTVDVLIPAHQDYVRSSAFHALASYFPDVTGSRLRVLLNNPVCRFNPESIIFKSGRKADCVYVLLTGQVEMIHTRKRVYRTLSSGAMLGEGTALVGRPVAETYRAASFVQALRIPKELYAMFVKSNGLYDRMVRQLDVRSFLYTNRLLGDAMSCTRQNAITAAVTLKEFPQGAFFDNPAAPGLALLKSGHVELRIGDRVVERLGPGDFLGESTVLFGMADLFTAHAISDVQLFTIPASVLGEIPVIRWKLQEAYEARLDKTVTLDDKGSPLIWLPQYGTGIESIDREHQDLFVAAQAAYSALFDPRPGEAPDALLQPLVEMTRQHFETEEELMRLHGYPALEFHAAKHQEISRALASFCGDYRAVLQNAGNDIGTFVKQWVMAHILTEDRKLGTYLKDLGAA